MIVTPINDIPLGGTAGGLHLTFGHVESHVISPRVIATGHYLAIIIWCGKKSFVTVSS